MEYETTLSWIQDFLSDRTQTVVLEGNSSSTNPVASGVPLGSLFKYRCDYSCFPVRWDFTLVNGCLEYKRECWCYLFGCFWFYLITRFPVLSLSPVVSSLSLSPVFLVLSLSPVVSGCISITKQLVIKIKPKTTGDKDKTRNNW
jgi:hypothetical protein